MKDVCLLVYKRQTLCPLYEWKLYFQHWLRKCFVIGRVKLNQTKKQAFEHRNLIFIETLLLFILYHFRHAILTFHIKKINNDLNLTLRIMLQTLSDCTPANFVRLCPTTRPIHCYISRSFSSMLCQTRILITPF